MHTPSAGKAVHILLGIFNRKIIWPRPLRAIGNHQTVALLCNSIGLSPPRLHYDRAANYGSIIVPDVCPRRYRQQIDFCYMGSIALP